MAEIVVMPKLNLTMEEGVIVEWVKNVGDAVEVDEILCSIETEKSTVEMESPSRGFLLKIWGDIGEAYPIKTPIALIGQLDEDITELVDQIENKLNGKSTQDAPDVTTILNSTNIEEQRTHVKMLPKVRKLVQELKIDLDALVTYCDGRKITEQEVYSFQQTLLSSSTPASKSNPLDRYENMNTIRRTIAANMIESCQKTARLTNVTEVDITKTLEVIKEYKGEKPSLTAVVVKACALAIKENAIINTEVNGNEIIYRSDVNIGVAIDIPGGLIVPVIHKANIKNVVTLSKEIEDLKSKATQGVLKQEELTGGTFTVTNVGMLGVEFFTPIINFPQTAIMGVGTVRRLPRYLDNTSDTIVSCQIMKLCLTYDHRIIDGAPAARFSLRVRDLLQNPEFIFV